LPGATVGGARCFFTRRRCCSFHARPLPFRARQSQIAGATSCCRGSDAAFDTAMTSAKPVPTRTHPKFLTAIGCFASRRITRCTWPPTRGWGRLTGPPREPCPGETATGRWDGSAGEDEPSGRSRSADGGLTGEARFYKLLSLATPADASGHTLSSRWVNVPSMPFWLFWCDSISAVVSRAAPSRGSRASPPAPRPQVPVRRKAHPLSDLRPAALVRFRSFGRDGVKDSSSCARRPWSAGTDKASAFTGAGKVARGRLDDRRLKVRFVNSSWKCIAQIPPGVLPGSMASCSRSASASRSRLVVPQGRRLWR
jgi:hypothetical protein